ncbi:unnamed protein product [Heterobilharzia americana]|nr:unnamed protein product [Heterobilharzia americana]CAH8455543.1 unnamed protein product [Heterobilharzia americana]
MLVQLVGFFLFLHTTTAIEKSRGALGSRVFTFVHGDEQAKLNFSAAEDFCRFSVGKVSESESTLSSTGKKDLIRLSSRPVNQSEGVRIVIRTSLASLHSYPENLALVNWISKQENHSFWIGGQVIKTMNEFLRSIYVLHWSDGSRSDFSFLRLPNQEIFSMRMGERRCISVDYISGQWGVHLCSEKRYFVCLTVPVIDQNDTVTPEKKKEAPPRPGSEKLEKQDSMTEDELGDLL